MNRKIKFRGFSKRFIPNEWFYGDLVNYREQKYILPEGENVWDIIGDGVEVHSKSVGQFTGFYDRNGKEIYEGDILSIEVPKLPYQLGRVFYKEGCFWVKEGELQGFVNKAIRVYKIDNILIEIIGNIYENPELFKEKR